MGITEKLIIMVIFILLGEKTFLIIKGENIYPREIENALYKIKDVEECAKLLEYPINFLVKIFVLL